MVSYILSPEMSSLRLFMFYCVNPLVPSDSCTMYLSTILFEFEFQHVSKSSVEFLGADGAERR
jgi:hypothetical protein